MAKKLQRKSRGRGRTPNIPSQLEDTLQVMHSINRKAGTILMNTEEIAGALVDDQSAGRPGDDDPVPDPGFPPFPNTPDAMDKQEWQDLIMAIKSDVVINVIDEIMPLLKNLQAAAQPMQPQGQRPQYQTPEDDLIERMRNSIEGKIMMRRNRYAAMQRK